MHNTTFIIHLKKQRTVPCFYLFCCFIFSTSHSTRQTDQSPIKRSGHHLLVSYWRNTIRLSVCCKTSHLCYYSPITHFVLCPTNLDDVNTNTFSVAIYAMSCKTVIQSINRARRHNISNNYDTGGSPADCVALYSAITSGAI